MWLLHTWHGDGNEQVNKRQNTTFKNQRQNNSLLSLLQNNAVPEKEDIKEVLDGNICRCTGYRPIFDAFLSFNDDPITEIEDLVTGKGIRCSKTGKPCPGSCSAQKVWEIGNVRKTDW